MSQREEEAGDHTTNNNVLKEESFLSCWRKNIVNNEKRTIFHDMLYFLYRNWKTEHSSHYIHHFTKLYIT
jgi:hypothetical protein